MKKKILILEDDYVNQELLKIYLGNEYDLTVASSVMEAISALSAAQYNLIITDLNLGNDPKGDGVDFLKYVRSNTLTQKTPIAAYSAYNNPNDTNDIQFSAFIPKPINKSEFLAVVNRILATG